MNAHMISSDDYEDACANDMGWCPHCKEFTRAQTEPDAEGYDCDQCEKHDVVGAENALIMGMIEFED